MLKFAHCSARLAVSKSPSLASWVFSLAEGTSPDSPTAFRAEAIDEFALLAAWLALLLASRARANLEFLWAESRPQIFGSSATRYLGITPQSGGAGEGMFAGA